MFTKTVPTLRYEINLWNQGYRYVVGIDEVGRGAFAGPVVVGGVIFPPDTKQISGIRDSKLLTYQKREQLFPQIIKNAHSYAIAEIPVGVINRVGIVKATQIGYRKVIKQITPGPEFILMDAFYIAHVPKRIQLPIIKGDMLCYSIAAASIVAKVYRDKLMQKLAARYTVYGFHRNVGYGTKKHQEAIRNFGLCPLHRTSFALKKFLAPSFIRKI
jgi:ribonuclease HII